MLKSTKCRSGHRVGIVACNEIHLATPKKSQIYHQHVTTTYLLLIDHQFFHPRLLSSLLRPISALTPIKRTQDVLGAVKASHKVPAARCHGHPHKLSELIDIDVQDDDKLGESQGG